MITYPSIRAGEKSPYWLACRIHAQSEPIKNEGSVTLFTLQMFALKPSINDLFLNLVRGGLMVGALSSGSTV